MMTIGESEQRAPGSVRRRPIRNDALERGSSCQSSVRGPERQWSARSTLPDLLAAHLRFYLSARVSGQRRTGSNAGFFRHDPQR